MTANRIVAATFLLGGINILFLLARPPFVGIHLRNGDNLRFPAGHHWCLVTPRDDVAIRPYYEMRCVSKRALRPNHVWSYDFVEDRTEKNRKLRMLVVIDEFTRENLAIEVAWSFTARQVVDVLGYLFAVRGIPEHIRSDNGPEFVAREVTRWLYQARVKTLFIAKGSPWENGYVESFNSRLRDELLNQEVFIGLEDARWVVDRWRLDYNHHLESRVTLTIGS